MNKEQITNYLKLLPMPSLGGIAYDKGFFHDGKPILNLRDTCIEMVKDVAKISNAKEILESGCHGGCSSAIFLSLTDANVTSIDLCDGTGHIELEYSYNDYFVPGTRGGINEIIRLFNEWFPGRFRFFAGSSYEQETIDKYKDKNYDLMFVDGDHTFNGARGDCKVAVQLNIPYVLVDDYTTCQEIRDGCNLPELELVKIYDNIHNFANIGIALFKNKNVVK